MLGHKTEHFFMRYFFVDPGGFEPPTSSLQMRRSTTKLRARFASLK
jgi:hypothetical protein